MSNANIRFLEDLAKCLPEEKQSEFTILWKTAYLKYEMIRKMEKAKKIVEQLQAKIEQEN